MWVPGCITQKMCYTEDVSCSATGFGWISIYPGAGSHALPRSTEWRAMLITSGRSQSEEVHRIERRVDLDAFGDDVPGSGRLPSFYVRASGFVLLVAMTAVICYSATL